MGIKPIFLSGSSSVVTPSDWSSVLSAMTDQISVGTIVGVIAAAVGAGIGLVFMWWGVRKLVKVLMGAFKSGKLKL